MSTKPQVLVIDDDAVVGRSFDRVLSDKGYEVSTVLSGEEAMKEMESHEYDVVFTDIKMPGMDQGPLPLDAGSRDHRLRHDGK